MPAAFWLVQILKADKISIPSPYYTSMWHLYKSKQSIYSECTNFLDAPGNIWRFISIIKQILLNLESNFLVHCLIQVLNGPFWLDIWLRIYWILRNILKLGKSLIFIWQLLQFRTSHIYQHLLLIPDIKYKSKILKILKSRVTILAKLLFKSKNTHVLCRKCCV